MFLFCRMLNTQIWLKDRRYFHIEALRLRFKRYEFVLFDLMFDGKKHEDDETEFWLTLLKVGKKSAFEIGWMEWVKHLDIFFFRFKHKNSL